jgi:hypothetical protein
LNVKEFKNLGKSLINMIESGSTKSLELHNSCRKGERDSLTWISFPLSGCGAGQLESSYHVVFFLNKYETNLLLLGVGCCFFLGGH